MPISFLYAEADAIRGERTYTALGVYTRGSYDLSNLALPSEEEGVGGDELLWAGYPFGARFQTKNRSAS